MKDHFIARTPEEFAAYWEKLNPPVRPSNHMMAIYDRFLRQYGLHEAGDWGLLGCTPEIRSLAGEYGRSLTCVDRSALAYEAFRLLCQPSIDEQFIENDWVEAECPNEFDMVLGDGSVSMLLPERHRGFIQNLHSMIRPDGIALLRIQVRDGCQFDSPEELVSWFHKQEGQNSINTCTRGYLQILWADPETGTILPDDFRERIEGLYAQGILMESEYQDFKGQPMKLTVNFTTCREFEQLLAPYFEVLGVEEPNDFLSCEHYPIYALKKK